MYYIIIYTTERKKPAINRGISPGTAERKDQIQVTGLPTMHVFEGFIIKVIAIRVHTVYNFLNTTEPPKNGRTYTENAPQDPTSLRRERTTSPNLTTKKTHHRT